MEGNISMRFLSIKDDEIKVEFFFENGSDVYTYHCKVELVEKIKRYGITFHTDSSMYVLCSSRGLFSLTSIENLNVQCSFDKYCNNPICTFCHTSDNDSELIIEFVKNKIKNSKVFSIKNMPFYHLDKIKLENELTRKSKKRKLDDIDERSQSLTELDTFIKYDVAYPAKDISDVLRRHCVAIYELLEFDFKRLDATINDFRNAINEST